MTSSLSTSSSLCIPIKTGKRHKSAWQQWMTPIKVMESITEALCEGTSYRKGTRDEFRALFNRARYQKTSWNGDFGELPFAKAIESATEYQIYEDNSKLVLRHKPNPRTPGFGDFIEYEKV